MKSDLWMRGVAAMLSLAVSALSSCVMEEVESACAGSGSKVEFVLKNMDDFTKSGFGASETVVEDVTVMAYSGGLLLGYGSWRNGEVMALDLDKDATYDFYALANVGEFVPPVLETSVSEILLDAAHPDAFDRTFPMCWSLKGYAPADDAPVVVDLVRLVSKVVLDVDCGDTGLLVTEVSLMQTPSSVYPFASGGSRASDGMISAGDVASASDLAMLASGGNVSFYMLENMQGTLLPGNTDPMMKVPSNLSGVSGVCSYMEVECSFLPESGREGSARYRIYLGEDEVTNFDVRRNRVLAVSLKFTSEGLKVKGSWKINADYVQHVTGVEIDRTDMEILIGETVLLNAVVSPSDAENDAVSWESDDPEVAVVGQDGRVTGVGEGTCHIVVRSQDKTEFQAGCEVSVVDAVSSIRFDKSETYAFLGSDGSAKTSDFCVYAVYLSGKTVDVTDKCTYASSTSCASVPMPGVVSHDEMGTAVIEAVYEGFKAEMTAVTEAFAVSGVEFEHSRYDVPLGDTPVIRYRVLYNDGTCSDFTGYQYWSGEWADCNSVTVADPDILELSVGGKVTAKKVGSTTVTVSVSCRVTWNSFETTVPVNVTDAYLVSVYAEGPAMFYDNSEGPVLYGVYSDGSEKNLTSLALWTTDDPAVTYSSNEGLQVSGSHGLTTGVSSVTFTGTFQGMSASVSIVYGKWVREAGFRRTSVSASAYNYKMVVVYADFTEVAVPFTYQTSTDGTYWSATMNGTTSGVTVTKTTPETRLRARTVGGFYDRNGARLIWTIGY